MSGPAPALRLAEDAEGRLADAQSGNCPACVRPLPLSGGVLTFVAPPDEGPVVPILVHEDCLREARRWPDFAVLAERLAGDRAEAAAQALVGAVAHARGAVETAAKALAAADIKTVQAKADRAVEKAEAAAQEAFSTATAAQTDAAAARAETETAKAELVKARQAAGEWKTLAERLLHAIVVFLVEADPSADGDYYVNQKRPFQDLADAVPEPWRKHFEAKIRKGAR